MMTVAIIKRRLREGKTYQDFRKAWYHTIGFGTSSKLYSVISASDPRDIIVIGFVEMSQEDALSTARIDVKVRLANPLEEVIEPEIGRQFGIMVSEDDFSAAGAIDYQPASIGGKETDLEEIFRNLTEYARVVAQASKEREQAREARDSST